MEIFKFAAVLACAVSLGASDEGTPADVEVPKGSLAECHLCKTVTEKVYKRVGDDLSKKSINYALDHVCNDLTFFAFPFLHSKCRALVSSKFIDAVDLFVAKTEPSAICQSLIHCDVEKKPETEPEHEKQQGASILCSFCENVVDKVYHIVGGDKTESNVAHALDLVCDNFFVNQVSFVHNLCIDLVDNKLRHVSYLLLAGMQAKELCYEVKICDKPRP